MKIDSTSMLVTIAVSFICILTLKISHAYDHESSRDYYPRCYTNADCPHYEMCDGKKCVSACDNRPCAPNTMCSTNKHKRICSCLPHSKGDPYNHGCDQLYSGPYCDNDAECADHQICVEKICVNACDHQSLCGTNTSCVAENHFSICRCLPGLTGDPYGRGCAERSADLYCYDNLHCADDEICVEKRCVNACDNYHRILCGPNSFCTTKKHVSVCECLNGFSSIPYGSGCVRSTHVLRSV